MTEEFKNYNLSQLEVLVLENNVFVGKLLGQILRNFNFKDVHLSTKVDDAIGYFQNNSVDLIFSNWAPQSEEINFLKSVRDIKTSKNPFVPIIVVSSYNEKRYVELARDLGMTDFLTLPINAHAVYQHVCNVIEKPRAFIQTENYLGPDRRRHDIAIEFEERRKHAADPAEAPVESSSEDPAEAPAKTSPEDGE